MDKGKDKPVTSDADAVKPDHVIGGQRPTRPPGDRGVRLIAYRNTPIDAATASAAALEVFAEGDPNWRVSDWQLEENRLVSALASRIAGRTLEPAWLRQGLKDAARAICFALRDEAKHPNRKPLRSRLLETQAAIELLTSGLTDKAIRSALEGPDQAGFDAIASAWRALRDMRPLVGAAIAAVPHGQGKQKHYPSPVASPLCTCANFVSVAWCEVRGKPVPHTSEAPQVACEELWNLAGGGSRPHSSGVRGTTKGWRNHLLASKDLPQTDYDPYKKVLIGRWL